MIISNLSKNLSSGMGADVTISVPEGGGEKNWRKKNSKLPFLGIINGI